MFSCDKILCYVVVVTPETLSNYLSESKKDLSTRRIEQNMNQGAVTLIVMSLPGLESITFYRIATTAMMKKQLTVLSS